MKNIGISKTLKKTIYSVKVLFIVATMIMSIFTIGQTNVFAEDQQTIDLASRDGWITSINVYKKENNKQKEIAFNNLKQFKGILTDRFDYDKKKFEYMEEKYGRFN